MKAALIIFTGLFFTLPIMACNLPAGTFICDGDGSMPFRVWFNPVSTRGSSGLAIGWPSTESTFIADTQGELVQAQQPPGRSYASSGKFSCKDGATTVIHEYILKNMRDTNENRNAKMNFIYRLSSQQINYTVTGTPGRQSYYTPGMHTCTKAN